MKTMDLRLVTADHLNEQQNFIGATMKQYYADKITWKTSQPVWVNQWLLTQEKIQALMQEQIKDI